MQKINWSYGVTISGKEIHNHQELENLLQQHSLIVINDLSIRDQQHFREFATQFGELFPTVDYITVTKDIQLDHWADTKHEVDDFVTRTKIGPINATKVQGWHQDGAGYTTRRMLSFATVRFDSNYDSMQIVGDTLFSNSRVVYENLSEIMKSWLRSLKVTHTSVHYRSQDWLLARLLEEGLPKKDLTAIAKRWMQIKKFTPKPFTTDLVNGSSAGEWLDFNPKDDPRIEGITQEESDMIVKYLVEKINDPNLHYAHRWKPDQVVIWDNRYLVHRMMNNANDEFDRRFWRVQSIIKEDDNV